MKLKSWYFALAGEVICIFSLAPLFEDTLLGRIECGIWHCGNVDLNGFGFFAFLIFLILSIPSFLLAVKNVSDKIKISILYLIFVFLPFAILNGETAIFLFPGIVLLWLIIILLGKYRGFVGAVCCIFLAITMMLMYGDDYLQSIIATNWIIFISSLFYLSAGLFFFLKEDKKGEAV